MENFKGTKDDNSFRNENVHEYKKTNTKVPPA